MNLYGEPEKKLEKKKKNKLASTEGIKIHCFIQPQKVCYVTGKLDVEVRWKGFLGLVYCERGFAGFLILVGE